LGKHNKMLRGNLRWTSIAFGAGVGMFALLLVTLIRSYSQYWTETTISDKSVETLHRSRLLQNIELGGRGMKELTLVTNKIKLVHKHRQASFFESVSTTFVTLCSLHWRLMLRNIITNKFDVLCI